MSLEKNECRVSPKGCLFPGFAEFCSGCCLPLLSQLVCSILTTWKRPYEDSLYIFKWAIYCSESFRKCGVTLGPIKEPLWIWMHLSPCRRRRNDECPLLSLSVMIIVVGNLCSSPPAPLPSICICRRRRRPTLFFFSALEQNANTYSVTLKSKGKHAAKWGMGPRHFYRLQTPWGYDLPDP